MPYYDLVIAIIKDFALVIAVVVAVISLVIHWEALFRPDLKRIEERRFKAVEEVYSLITDYRFVPLYVTEKGMPADELRNLLNEKMIGTASPFLPEYIKKSLGDFLYKLTMLFLLPRDQNHQDYIEEFKKEKVMLKEAHEKVYLETVNWFGCSGKSLPFPVKPIGLGQQDSRKGPGNK